MIYIAPKSWKNQGALFTLFI